MRHRSACIRTKGPALAVRRRRWTAAVLCALLVGAIGSVLLPVTTIAATSAEIQRTIDKAKAFIYAQQQNGNWESVAAPTASGRGSDQDGPQWGGQTALATYALLAAGESPQDPRIQKAVEFLQKSEITGNYALGCRAQVWTFLPKSDKVKLAIKRDAALLTAAQVKTGPAKGLYEYTPEPSARIDHSVSQYGVLGMWACADFVEVPQRYWTDVDAVWRAHQHPNGGWSYMLDASDRRGDTMTMTAAGVATLFITQEMLYAQNAAECKGNIKDADIERGMKWIADNFKEFTEKVSPYGYYGIERVGVASGRKYINGVNWYQDLADRVVKEQRVNGQIGTAYGGANATCLCLLMLARGGAPVMFNKLQYEIGAAASAGANAAKTEANWNQRPRDVANLSRWVGKQVERTLNWQIVDLAPPVEELFDAPILYIAGNQALNFSALDKEKLRAYVEAGGLIVGNADCSTMGFATSFKKLGSELFPAYEFRALPTGHAIYTAEQFPFAKMKRKPTLLGLTNGSRELMLLFPDADPGKAWQLLEVGGKEELYQLAANIYLYAIDKRDLRSKGDTFIVKPSGNVAARTVAIARIKYSGNWDPEPGGWRRLSAVMATRDGTGLETRIVELGKGQLIGADAPKIAHLTGTGPFTFDDAARKEIKAFSDAGGTLIVDACGGSSDFATAAIAELQAIFGPEVATALEEQAPQKSPIYTASGIALDNITFREFTRGKLVGDAKKPHLRTYERGGRAMVVYSREDISTGLVGEAVDGVMGYSPEGATTVARCIILGLAKSGAAEPAAPATAPATAPTTGQPTAPTRRRRGF